MLNLCIFHSWFRWDGFFTGRSNFMDRRLIVWPRNILMLKTYQWWICFLKTCSFSLHKTLFDGLEWCGLLVHYCDVFISCLDSHSDGTHSLQMIHWWASDVMLNFSKSVLMKNQTHPHLDRPEGEYISSQFKFPGELCRNILYVGNHCNKYFLLFPETVRCVLTEVTIYWHLLASLRLVCCWLLKTTGEQWTIPLRSEIFRTTWPDITLVTSPISVVSNDTVLCCRALRIWDVERDKLVTDTDHNRAGGVCCVFHPHGGIIATGYFKSHYRVGTSLIFSFGWQCLL